jgi:Concanavalin A-like lectin/glucanases superfamily
MTTVDLGADTGLSLIGTTKATGNWVLMMLEGGPLDDELQVVENLPTYPGATLRFNLTNFQTFDPSASTETVTGLGLQATYVFVGPGPDPGDPSVPDNAGDNWTASYIFEFTGESYVPTPPGGLVPGPMPPVDMGQILLSATTTLVPDTLPITSEPVVLLVGQSGLTIDATTTRVQSGVVAMSGETSMPVTPDWTPQVVMQAASTMRASSVVEPPSLAYEHAVMASSPLAYWPCTDPAGATEAEDIAGTYPLQPETNSVGGTVFPIFGVSGPFADMGDPATAVSWNGSDTGLCGCFSAQPVPPVTTDTFTVEMWALCDQPQAAVQMLAVINVPANAYSTDTFMMQMSAGYGGPYASPGGTIFPYWIDVDDGVWHHWALTYNNGQWAIYKDGLMYAQANSQLVTAGFVPTNVTFGARQVGASAQWDQVSIGSIAHIALYNRVLPQTEIVSHLISATSFTTYRQLIMSEGPVAYFPLQDLPGSSSAAELVRGTPGVVQGGVTFGVPDPWGSAAAARFDGTTGDVVDASQRPGGCPQVFSLECWYRTTQAANTFLEFNAAQVSGGTFTPDIYMGNGYLNGRVYTSAPYSYAEPNPSADGQWHHGVITWDSSSYMRVYRDGQLVVGGQGAGLQQVFGGYWHIGNGGAGFAAADICHVAAYPFVLTPAQVLSHATYQPH